jgi:polyisoprenoid-binding protein YceI
VKTVARPFMPGPVAPASRLVPHANPYSADASSAGRRFYPRDKLALLREAEFGQPSIPSAIGAPEVSPARKRWVSAKKIPSAVGAALPAAKTPTNMVLAVAALAFAVLAPSLAAQQYSVTLDPAQTTIAYTVDSTLHAVHGTFQLKSGEIHFDPATGKATGRIVVDATTGDSGNKSRDKKMHLEILESQKYPEITFTPQIITGTFNPQAASQLALDGIFQLKGQEHPLTATVAVAPPEGPALHSTVTFTIPYIKWGLKDPSTWLLKASDTVTVEIQSTAKLTPDQPQH